MTSRLMVNEQHYIVDELEPARILGRVGCPNDGCAWYQLAGRPYDGPKVGGFANMDEAAHAAFVALRKAPIIDPRPAECMRSGCYDVKMAGGLFGRVHAPHVRPLAECLQDAQYTP